MPATMAGKNLYLAIASGPAVRAVDSVTTPAPASAGSSYLSP